VLRTDSPTTAPDRRPHDHRDAERESAFDTGLSERLPDLATTDRKIVLRPVRLMS
jgi:hypothetical protein